MLDSEKELKPSFLEKKLLDNLQIANKVKDKEMLEEIKRKLVRLYITQGEYFKFADRPDPHLAKSNLIKAIRYDSYNAVANYRLGYLYYREERYAQAITHFEYALIGTPTEGLNDTQTMLANMFLVNCGIHIARTAILEVQHIEDNFYSDLEKEKVEQFKKEIHVLNEEVFGRMFYHRIKNRVRERINEEEFHAIAPMLDEVFLRISEQGRELIFPEGQRVRLTPIGFYVVYTILTENRFLTYRDLKKKTKEWSDIEVTEENIRQIISRLSRDCRQWSHVFETGKAKNSETGRNMTTIKLADGFKGSILCRADEILPSPDVKGIWTTS